MKTRNVLLLVAAAALLPCTSGIARGGDAPTGYLGFHVEPLSILSPAQRKELGTELDEGNVVAAIIHGGPADGAGLKLGDLLLSLGGHDIPPLKTHDRYNPVHHQWRVAMRELFAAIPLGDVKAVVRRGEKTLTLTIHAVDEATMHKMEGGNDARVPPPSEAGPPTRMQLLFEKPADGGDLPAGFVVDEGHWHLVEHDAATSLHGVLRQDLTVLPWAAVVATGPGRSYTDGHVQVHFKTLSGITDASGGVIWRAQDGRNYYLTRANALEDNFEIYIMRDGIRTDLAKVRVKLPAFNEWHVIDVWFHGSTFRATLDGANAVEAQDTTWSSGYCGLWTKADSVTLFDDFDVTPEK